VALRHQSAGQRQRFCRALPPRYAIARPYERPSRAAHVADGGVEHLTARLTLDGHEQTISGDGNGPVDAFVHAVRETYGFDIHVLNYHEYAIGVGEDAAAVSYVQLRVGADRAVYGVGMDSNIVTATLLAVVSAVNRAIAREWLALPIAVVAA